MSDQISFDDLCEATRQACRLAEEDPQGAIALFQSWSEEQGRALGIHADACETCTILFLEAASKAIAGGDPISPVLQALGTLRHRMNPGEYVTIEELEAEERAREEEWRAKIQPFIERHPELALDRWGFPPDFRWYGFQAAAEAIASLARRAAMKDGDRAVESDVVLLDDGALLVAGRARVTAEEMRTEVASSAELWIYGGSNGLEIIGVDPSAATLLAWITRAAARKPDIFRRFVCEPLADGRNGVRLRYLGVKEQPHGGWEDDETAS